MARNAKRTFLNLNKEENPTLETVEQFWKIVGEKNTTVDTVVEYGAEYQSIGSPSHIAARMHITRLPDEVLGRYLDGRYPWCLDNFVDSSVSALTYQYLSYQAWMCVGMIFSTFGWHNEPHWSYCVDHLHFGNSKTWYAVPGQYAEKFEETMKELAPELFEDQPDTLLLHDSLVNPNALMEKGVPVYRMDQNVGEFVITFPRAYICSFNHGFNVAEAVNFAPADWIKIGRKCVEEYALLKKYCLFSHDELMFKIAKDAANSDVRLAAAVYHDLYYSIKTELKLRQFVVGQWGCSKDDHFRFNFERMPDDRQCFHCKTTIYLSAVTCKCAIDAGIRRMVCIKHYDKLCTTCTPQNHLLMKDIFQMRCTGFSKTSETWWIIMKNG
ncbi:lysine-specific demethylase lid-like [Nilaparvata lugens]|uniref:lysine-specific demethylase lid-like n=1 Tax=Nilaparvata lugens TaxID=108931 RepID=UPI00193CE9ED|nr:lysine-specific demethylase lid-like [Nilaparvata lugens]